MASSMDADWKKGVGFPINYSSESSEDDFDSQEVVFRHSRRTDDLLADSGDGTEADMLGTTPPRTRIRQKNIHRRNFLDTNSPAVQRILNSRRNVVDQPNTQEGSPASDKATKKRSFMKQMRNRQRDSKQDLEIDGRCDSMPAIATLVDTSSRFMSLTSRPKNRESIEPVHTPPQLTVEDRWRCDGEEELPASRVNFHKTFSLLINMGSIEKGCKRAISREEQVWQNELKELIWLELQAKLAGRTLAQQDAYLCAQRNVVPKLIEDILNYKFVNKNPCRRLQQKDDVSSSQEELVGEQFGEESGSISEEEQMLGCLSFDCQECVDAISAAMREVGALLDSFYGALSLYPSRRSMTAEHPLISTAPFNNRMKAMCMWYNTALHMRLKMVAMLRMLRSMKLKSRGRNAQHRTSVDSDVSRQSSECHKPQQVRFNVSNTPSDSNNSDSSAQSEVKESDGEGKESQEKTEGSEADSGIHSTGHTGPTTPEIVITDRYGTSDTSASCESGYASSAEKGFPGEPPATIDIAAVAELAEIQLLNKCDVSLYRGYHREVLKTQGVRRCMNFICKMRVELLDKVYLTLEKPQNAHLETCVEEESAEVFNDLRPDVDRSSPPEAEEQMKNYELRRYGCWSEECISMRLPSYRSHFLLLSCICMDAIHDYLSLRLETRPEHPSCLTVKQLINELREGLDISSEMRSQFVRHVRGALGGRKARGAAGLLRLLQHYDDTVHALLKQYLSYLTTMSETESMPRSCLQAEWAFTARLAKRIKSAASLAPIAFSDITCNQLKLLLGEFNREFGKLVVEEVEVPDPDKETVYAVCRSIQSIYAWSRDTALQAAQWARALSARLARAPYPSYVQQRGDMFNCLMDIRDSVVRHIEYVLERSKAVPPKDVPREFLDALAVRVRELLLQIYKLGFEIHKEVHRFVTDARSAVHSPQSPPTRTSRFVRTDSIVEDYESNATEERLFDAKDGQPQSSIERLLSGQRASTDECDGVEFRERNICRVSCEEKQWAGRVARAVIQFAKCWMQFVVERCDRGRGLRPRWASQGLEFLMLACDPCNTKHLSDEEFEELKQLMDGCISHVIGSRPAPCSPDAPHSPRPKPRLTPSPIPSVNASKENLTLQPPSPPNELDVPLIYPEVESAAHRRRVLDAIESVDRQRDQRLRNTKSVGKVLEAAVTSYEPKLRQLSFKWQRGLKIGAGTFGKVYTVVNTESGQLLAMKELSIGVGDRRALQRAANELKVLEGVIHPHLVRYYGCELHREEMLLFMELCVEGSLEALVATSGALGETCVRRYTKQLLSAVRELHDRSIAHRDIKSGNIFLTNEGHCLKLGDFGCAVKIRAHTTAPGELQGFVGTQAYMAPEVFMKSSGHGRAADIWSLGCVVTEMASGKRPFSEYDSNYQIMFLVGMGGRPEIPETLSEEGQQFCLSCLTHDPDQRPRADSLTSHHFLMVKSDFDCKCEPAYLIT